MSPTARDPGNAREIGSSIGARERDTVSRANLSGMFEYAEAAVEAAIAAGARYADARVMDRRHESVGARNAEIEGLTPEQSVGIGVRLRLPVVSVGIDVAQALTIPPGSSERPGPRLHLNFSPKL